MGFLLNERLLMAISRDPGRCDYAEGQQQWTGEGALSILERVFPNFMEAIIGKKILDFGCGEGYQVIALAKGGAQFVMGVDSNPLAVKNSEQLADSIGLSDRVRFATTLPDDMFGFFDMIISQNSFEHFSNPLEILFVMKKALNQSGKIFITFGPPWFAPYGSHTQFFVRLPWVNILFREQTVMKARSRYRSDGAKKYEDVEDGLNKMTIRKFEHLLRRFASRVEFKKYECVKGMNFLRFLPFVRELFINHASCILVISE